MARSSRKQTVRYVFERQTRNMVRYKEDGTNPNDVRCKTIYVSKVFALDDNGEPVPNMEVTFNAGESNV